MRPDSEVEHDVRSELTWTPGLTTTDVAVKVKDGVVSLTGFATSYAQKFAIENAAKRIIGVAGVANDLIIPSLTENHITDPEITREIVRAVRAQLPAIADSIKVLVHEGHVVLEGNSPHRYLRDQAEELAAKVAGVAGVTNSILIQTDAQPGLIQAQIEKAFHRNAQVDSHGTVVKASGGVVTLEGKVRSLLEREEALRVACSAPGVIEVRSAIVVSP